MAKSRKLKAIEWRCGVDVLAQLKARPDAACIGYETRRAGTGWSATVWYDARTFEARCEMHDWVNAGANTRHPLLETV